MLRKYLSFLLIFVLLFSLSACREQEQPEEPAPQTPYQNPYYNTQQDDFIIIGPAGEVFLQLEETAIASGETLFSQLKAVCLANNMELDFAGDEENGPVCITGINGVSEFDQGPDSGWVCYVNEKRLPNDIYADFLLKPGNKVIWQYLTQSYDISGKSDNVIIDLSISTRFSQEEIQAAIDPVLEVFRGFMFCEMTELRYVEELSDEHVEIYLSRRDSDIDSAGNNVIALFTDFFVQTDSFSSDFEPGASYGNYIWILTRNDSDSPWQVDFHDIN